MALEDELGVLDQDIVQVVINDAAKEFSTTAAKRTIQ